MLIGYLKIAMRYLWRSPGYSLINIGSLAIGVACCILILLYVFHELSYDQYHQNANNIYRLAVKAHFSGKDLHIPKSSPPMADFLKANYPEVEDAVRFSRLSRFAVTYEDSRFYEGRIFFADHSVFKIFTFPILQGDPEKALETAYSVVVTESIARKYFGTEDPIGKILLFDNDSKFTVTGVIKDIRENSHFKFDMLCSFQTHVQKNLINMQNWIYLNYYTYLLLAEETNIADFGEKLHKMVDENFGTILNSIGGSMTVYLQSLKQIYLHSHLAQEISATSDITTIYIFSSIAIFVLIIACINFINLSTARTSKRLKEVGLRKVMGANRTKLIIQFLIETTLFTMISCISAVILVELCLPFFKSISGVQLSLDYDKLLVLLPLITILVTLAAGGYPAFYLSGFLPITMFKGNWIKRFKFRRSLVIFQFSISITMIICTMVIFQQINYMKNKELGFNKEQILVVPIRDNNIRRALPGLQEELRNFDGIVDVAASSHLPGAITYYNPYLPEGLDPTQMQWMGELYVDEYFVSTLDLEIVKGRNFLKEMSSDQEEAVMINETAMKKFGWEDPVGKTIYEIKNEMELAPRSVIAVIKDFHIESLHKKIEPLIVMINPGRLNVLSIKINPVNISLTLDWLKEKWMELDPDRPFEFWFLDDSFDRQYRSDHAMGRIFLYFAILALLVASLGLFGLVSYTSERRSKEIGIRKVLGASVTTIISMLTFEFSKWVLISNVIAWPIAYYVLDRWLQNFAYRVEVGWTPFLFSGLLALGISLSTVIFHSVKAATGNPVEVLRYE